MSTDLTKMTERQRIQHANRVENLEIDGEEDVEVGIMGEFHGSDPEVGIMSGGFEIHEAFRIDNGKEVVLTQRQKDDIMEDACMEASEGPDDDRPDYD